MNNEFELQKSIEEWLNKKGIWYFHLRTQSYMKRHKPRKMKGFPDLIIILKDILLIELKNPADKYAKLRKDQRNLKEYCSKIGANYFDSNDYNAIIRYIESFI